jgi:hypothetical protein
LYADEICLSSPLAKLYAGNGVVEGKAALATYWGEALRRLPNLKLELLNVYSGHQTISVHYLDNIGRNIVETIVFDRDDKAVAEYACRDKLR